MSRTAEVYRHHHCIHGKWHGKSTSFGSSQSAGRRHQSHLKLGGLAFRCMVRRCPDAEKRMWCLFTLERHGQRRHDTLRNVGGPVHRQGGAPGKAPPRPLEVQWRQTHLLLFLPGKKIWAMNRYFLITREGMTRPCREASNGRTARGKISQ